MPLEFQLVSSNGDLSLGLCQDMYIGCILRIMMVGILALL